MLIQNVHLSDDLSRFLLTYYRERVDPFCDTVTTPYTFQCPLYGPIMGDDPIKSRMTQTPQGPRPHVNLPVRHTGKLTVEAVGEPCVLSNLYAGPIVPPFPDDPRTSVELRTYSEHFWSEHVIGVK